LDNGESVTNLSKKYGIAKSTVCAIRNRKQKIVKAVTQNFGVFKKKNLKPSKMPVVQMVSPAKIKPCTGFECYGEGKGQDT
jgi:hypothetical protein